MPGNKPKTVDEYINSKPTIAQSKLHEMRKLIRSVVPQATETLKWGEPALIEPDGMILVIFAGYKHHMNLVATPSTIQALSSELSGYETGKGSIKLSYNQPIPTDLVKKVVSYRINEYREDGVKWR